MWLCGIVKKKILFFLFEYGFLFVLEINGYRYRNIIGRLLGLCYNRLVYSKSKYWGLFFLELMKNIVINRRNKLFLVSLENFCIFNFYFIFRIYRFLLCGGGMCGGVDGIELGWCVFLGRDVRYFVYTGYILYLMVLFCVLYWFC